MPWTRAALNRRSVVYIDTDQPQKRRLVSTLADLGYEDENGQIQQVDFAPQRVQNAQFNGWRVTQSGWHYGLETDGWNWFGGKRGQHFFKFRLSRIGYVQVDKGTTLDIANDWTDLNPNQPTANYQVANLSTQTRTQSLPDGDIVVGALAEWRNLWTTPAGGISVRWRVDGSRLKEDVVMPQAVRDWIAANRPPGYYGLPASTSWLSCAFQIDWTDIPKRLLAGIDISSSTDFTDVDGEIETRNELDELLFYMPIDYAYVDDVEGVRHSVRLRKRFWRSPGGQWYLVVGAKVSELAALPAGDLIFDPTLNPSVSASADDRNSNSAYGALDRPWLYIGRGLDLVTAGIRFTNISLSSADTVDSVYLTVVPVSSSWNRQQVILNFEDADNPGDFSSDYPEDRTVLATGGVVYSWDHPYSAGTPDIWPPNTPEQESLGSLLQQVISRPGWSSGNAVVLLDNHPDDANIGSADTYGYQVASYDYAPVAAPQLTIEYTAGAGGTTHNLAGSITAQASASGDLSITRSLVGVVAGQASASASLDVTRSLSGTVAGQVGASASLDVTRSLVGGITGVVSASAALGMTRTIGGTIAGTVGANADLDVTRPISGTIAGQVSAAAALSIAGQVDISGTIAGTASASASLDVTRSLAGILAGTVSASATLDVTSAAVNIGGVLVGIVSASADLRVERALSGTIGGVVSTSADIDIVRHLTGAVAGTVSATAALLDLHSLPDGRVWNVSAESRIWGVGAEMRRFEVAAETRRFEVEH